MESVKNITVAVFAAIWAATVWSTKACWNMLMWTIKVLWGITTWVGRVILWVGFWPLGLWRSIVHHSDKRDARRNR